jgi:hypothetical protein
MNKIRYFFVVIACVAATSGFGQDKKIKFATAFQAGLLEGGNGSALHLQLLNGISYRNWMATAGAGIDFYSTRTVPVFIELRKSFGQRSPAPFVYGSCGYNFVWINKSNQFDYMGLQEGEGGLYYEAGLGYQFPVAEKSQIFLSLGFSFKRYTLYSDYYAILPWPEPEVRQSYQYDQGRIALKTGIRF